MLKKPGCLVILILAVALILLGLIIGPLLSQFVGSSVPAFVKVPQPRIELPPEAIAHAGPLPITNTLLAAVLTTIVLSLLFILGTRKMSLVPRGLQNFLELIVEMLLNFVESVAGRHHGRTFFPLVATIFLFVIANAWLSLMPIFGTIGINEGGGSHGLLLYGDALTGFVGLLRGANTDVNVTATLAIMSFVFVEYWGIKANGLASYLSKFFRISAFAPKHFKSIKSLPMTLIMGIIDMFVGIIELISELIRLVSFTFRLFGNMTAGEILLGISTFLVPWIFSDIFYGLELLVGIIQALIFGGLTAVFATLAVASHEAEH